MIRQILYEQAQADRHLAFPDYEGNGTAQISEDDALRPKHTLLVPAWKRFDVFRDALP